MIAMHNVANSSGTAPPKTKAPANAADCHIHVYDPRFQPPVEKPSNGTVSDYRNLQKRIGVSRVVIVQPRNYGTDNSCTLDAIAQLGIANARGVAVLHPDVAEAELKKLNEGGIRGIRFTLGHAKSAVTSFDMIEPLAKRIAPYGWHVQLNIDPQQVIDGAAMFKRLPTQLVFDHMGKPPMPDGVNHESHKIIRSLIDARRAWVKVSGAYIVDNDPPVYAGATKVGQAFVSAAPERCVWGSDWPHPGPKVHPDDAVLFDLLAAYAPDEQVRNRILVDNPKQIYGFA